MDEVEGELESDPSRVNARGVHDLPALYFAAIGGNIEVAKRLLEGGADVNAKAESGAPIHGAVMGDGAAMVRLLLERGADPSLPDYQGRGARKLAEDMGRPDIAELFG